MHPDVQQHRAIGPQGRERPSAEIRSPGYEPRRGPSGGGGPAPAAELEPTGRARVVAQRATCLEPCLAVNQVFFAWIPGEDCSERSDDPPCVGPGAAVASRYVDHAEVASPAGCYRLVMEWAEVAHVVGDEGTALSTGERQHLWIWQGLAV